MVILVILIFLGMWFIYSYNKIVSAKEMVVNMKSQISIQLDRRGKVFDSLINSVKKAMDYEKTTLKDIISLREKSLNISGDPLSNKEKQDIEDQISEQILNGQFTKSFNMTVEAYPELKANDNLLQLQEEIVSTENKLSYAKQAFNDSLERYNALVSSVPYNIIVKYFPDLKKEFNYWKLKKEEVKVEEEKRVQF